MRRAARAILVSTSVRRRGEFPAWHEEAAILGNSAAVLATELSLVDPAFLVCAPFAVATDPATHRAAWVTTLGPALHPNLDGALVDALAAGRAVDTSLGVDPRTKSIAAVAPADPDDPHLEHLAKASAAADRACGRPGSVWIDDVVDAAPSPHEREIMAAAGGVN